VTAALCALAVAATFRGAIPAWWLPVALVLSWLCPALVASDLIARRLPDALTLSAYPLLAAALAVAGLAGDDPGMAERAFLGTLLFGGAHLLVHLLAPRAFGAGDVKLAGALGAPLGAVGLLAPALCAVGAAVVTAALAAAGRLRRSRDGPPGVPHGPGMLLACWLLAVLPGATWALRT
jgi:leader peptidase (prepilin peptidase)/N-methyltransferase